MPITVVRGPAGAAKSQYIQENAEPGDVILDVTALWAALTGVERDENGRYPVRRADENGLRLALYLRAAGVRFSEEQGFGGFATTSSSSPIAVERLRERGASGPVLTLDPGREVAERRLRDPDTGDLDPECSRALIRWYGA